MKWILLSLIIIFSVTTNVYAITPDELEIIKKEVEYNHKFNRELDQPLPVIHKFTYSPNTQILLDEAARWSPQCIATGTTNEFLTNVCEQQADWLANNLSEGHPNFQYRHDKIQREYPWATVIEEDMSKSDPGMNAEQAAHECMRCWKLGHWSYIDSQRKFYAFAMSRGRDGVWRAVWLGVR